MESRAWKNSVGIRRAVSEVGWQQIVVKEHSFHGVVPGGIEDVAGELLALCVSVQRNAYAIYKYVIIINP